MQTRHLFVFLLAVLAAACGKPAESAQQPAPSEPVEPVAATAVAAPAPAAAPVPVPVAPEPEPTEPPKLAPNSLLRPLFTTTEGELNAGSAFVVRWEDNRNVMITAHHLFGPAGGMTREISAAELPQVVKSVKGRSAGDLAVAVESNRLISIPDARAFGQQDLSDDLAAFALDDAGKAGVLAFAPGPPQVDARVYLLAEPIGKPAGLYPARVRGVTPKLISYELDDAELNLAGASGAPLLDAHGRVLGINLAGGPTDGKLYGYSNPVNVIRDKLGRALAAK